MGHLYLGKQSKGLMWMGLGTASLAGAVLTYSSYSAKSDEFDTASLNYSEYTGSSSGFSSLYNGNKKQGSYLCGGCGAVLFSSVEKYDSGTGWPSFWRPADKKNVATAEDNGFFSRRTEVLCAKCDGHLGHVFDDGPAPTGLRYCINGISLKFVEVAEQDQEDDKGEP